MTTQSWQIVALDAATLMQNLQGHFDFPHQLTSYAQTSTAEVDERIAAADIVITNKVALTAANLRHASRLKMIAVAATGCDPIDLDAAQATNIAVTNVHGYADDAVAEHAMMLILALMRALPAYQQDLRAGAWQQSPIFCHFGATMHDVYGKTLGIVGYGGIGQALAKRAQAFGMRILRAERSGAATIRSGYLAWQDVVTQADILSLHCPLTAQTQRLINADVLAAMPRHALLINVSRGGLVDEAALATALQQGQIAGAGLDVLSQEPPAADHPLMNLALPQLIITPHMAWGSVEARQRLFNQVIENIHAFVGGEKLRRVV